MAQAIGPPIQNLGGDQDPEFSPSELGQDLISDLLRCGPIKEPRTIDDDLQQFSMIDPIDDDAGRDAGADQGGDEFMPIIIVDDPRFIDPVSFLGTFHPPIAAGRLIQVLRAIESPESDERLG